MKNVFLILLFMLALFGTSCEKEEPVNDQDDIDSLLSEFIIGKWKLDFQGGLILSEFSDSAYVWDFVTNTDDTIPYNPIKYSVDDEKHWLKLHYDTGIKNYVVAWDEGYMIWNNPDKDYYEKWIRREE